MMASVVILALILNLLVCQVDPKSVNKEFSLDDQKDYKTVLKPNAASAHNIRPKIKHSKYYVPLVDGRPIYVPPVNMKNWLEANGSEREANLKDERYNLDNLKSPSLFNPEDTELEKDEVFSVENANNVIKSPSSKIDEKYLHDAHRKIKNMPSKTYEKDKHKSLEYEKIASVDHSKGDKLKIDYSNAKKDKEELVYKKDMGKQKPMQSIGIQSDTAASLQSTKLTSGHVSKITPNTTKNTANSSDKPLNKNKVRNFEFQDEDLEDHLSLQEEIKTMFSPAFKSFIFNPIAPNQAKFQGCKTSKNETGTCRYVQHCFLPSIVSTIDQFMNNVCIIEERFIGVCCPEFPVSKVQIKWQNEFENIEGVDEPAKSPEECGIGTKTRIIGGNKAGIKDWPWMVALLDNKGKFFCGGSLINNRYVLTAAHCTFGSRKNEIVARLGEYDLSKDQGVHEDYFVEEIKRHGQYNRLTIRNDIALLKLHKPVIFNEFIKTICLPDSQRNYTDEIATLTGWGHIQGGISTFTSDVLQEASFPVITNKECADIHGVSVPPSLICTRAPEKGACNGDSGGPLMLLDHENRWKVIGIVSWGRRGCATKYPSVFSRVSTYLDWIKEHAI